MIYLLAIYAGLGALLLSLWHSYKVILKSKDSGETANAILAGRREKKILTYAIGGAVAYASVILIVQNSLPEVSIKAWIVLTPVVYLLLWILPRSGKDD